MPNVFAIAKPSTRAWPRVEPGVLIAGKYRLERILAGGGMGTVWLAQNELLELPVALKLILPEIRCSETAARLLTEARVTAKLQHPNIVRVLDLGQTDDGDPFIVMELLEGVTFGDALAGRACDPVLAVRAILPVIDALCHAHAHGIVHRDLKPDNIVLVREKHGARPKLLDFGIAKVLAGVAEPRVLGRRLVLGNPAYMAPEQAHGSPHVDHRADIWSVCVVLYEALSGTPAFQGATAQDVLDAVIDSEVVELTGSDDVCSLWPIVARGLAKAPEHRYQTMRALGNALASWLTARGVSEDLSGDRLARSWNGVAAMVPPPPAAPALPSAAVQQRSADSERSTRAWRRPSFGRAALVVSASLGLSTLGSTLGERDAPPKAARAAHVVVPAPPAPRTAPPAVQLRLVRVPARAPHEPREPREPQKRRTHRAPDRIEAAYFDLKDPYR